ncbi:radical SAM family heme chaperone HemW [Pseudanabaena sp. UWO310]|uniref:radical SAM family heme chaperone HemW n=1 Tax=Pseudanabaena sp. UWO310 TaxID=2480795 RepID=UPI001160E796|nr:coproporphyrinogen III oxidase [Pseudanabaena sp. UWO310]
MSQIFPKSLYLHIPFCKRRCFYCDFAITTGGENLKQQYVDVLCQEIILTVEQIPPEATLQTIFFGGGTPSLLTVQQVAQILETIATYFAIATDAEISLEANAGTVGTESLQGYRSLGINRISLGAQAFQQELLDVCGRGHRVEDIYAAVDSIQKAGFENFSLDLISGLPHQSMTDWEYSLRSAIALQPTHFSIYDLIVEEGTAFGKRYQAGDRPLPSESLTVEMYLAAHRLMTAKGYEHYEISNYAKPSYQARHNLTYWYNQPFYGMGMGATSYINRQRIDRPRKIRPYFDAIAQWKSEGIGFTAPTITPAEELMDTLMQGLRLAEGLSLNALIAAFGRELCDRACECLERYRDRHWVEFVEYSEDIRIMLVSPDGWLFSNIIIADLYDNL